jgi:hypothetical protein
LGARSRNRTDANARIGAINATSDQVQLRRLTAFASDVLELADDELIDTLDADLRGLADDD